MTLTLTTLISAQLGLRTQYCFEAPGILRVDIVKMAKSCSTAKQHHKKKKKIRIAFEKYGLDLDYKALLDLPSYTSEGENV